jgi:hypothetical protein
MKLLFKNWSYGFSERDVPIEFKIGTLEDTCLAFNIDFWQIKDEVKKNEFDFMAEFLYQGYLTACSEILKHKKKAKIKYSKVQAIIWYEHMSGAAKKELQEKITILSSGIVKMTGKKKAVQKK